MKTLVIGFIIGAVLNGIYVQYRITGSVWGRPECSVPHQPNEQA